LPFATKQNKKLKLKGVRNTTTLTRLDTLLTPPILRLNIVLNETKRENCKIKGKGKKESSQFIVEDPGG